MKYYVDLKRSSQEFEEGDWVWLWLRPYRQHSVERRTCTKLSGRYYEPFQVIKKNNNVAYRLALPEGCTIIPVFHASLLKAFVGNLEDSITAKLPKLTDNAHPIIALHSIEGYRIVSIRGKKVEQVLVKWEGLPEEERTWEQLTTIARRSQE